MKIDDDVACAKVLQAVNDTCRNMSLDAILASMQRSAREVLRHSPNQTGYSGTMGYYIMVGHIAGDPRAGAYAKAVLAPWLIAKHLNLPEEVTP